MALANMDFFKLDSLLSDEEKLVRDSVQAFVHDRATPADRLGLFDLNQGRSGVADREEQLGVLVTAGSLMAPVHAYHSNIQHAPGSPTLVIAFTCIGTTSPLPGISRPRRGGLPTKAKQRARIGSQTIQGATSGIRRLTGPGAVG